MWAFFCLIMAIKHFWAGRGQGLGDNGQFGFCWRKIWAVLWWMLSLVTLFIQLSFIVRDETTREYFAYIKFVLLICSMDDCLVCMFIYVNRTPQTCNIVSLSTSNLFKSCLERFLLVIRHQGCDTFMRNVQF